MCACDLEPCPACAEREAAEWEPDPRAELDPEYLALFYGAETDA